MTIEFTAAEADKSDAPEDLLDNVEWHLKRSIHRLTEIIKEVETGKFDELVEAKKVTDTLTHFTRLYYEERNKVDKLRKSVAGAVGASELDFCAARDEIGRRLALLRDAGGH